PRYLPSLHSHGFSLDLFNVFPDVETALCYAVMRLLDSRRPYWEAVSQCRLASCGRFFLARKKRGGGRPNRTYCCPEHLEEHHNSAERKAATTKRAQALAAQVTRARVRKHK